MLSFPLFSDLESKRDRINEAFHRDTKPVLAERLQQFGFKPVDANHIELMKLSESATNNEYMLSFSPYAITVYFQHIKTHEQIKICDISNFALSAHTIMDIIINSINCWLQYGVIYEYVKAQKLEEEMDI